MSRKIAVLLSVGAIFMNDLDELLRLTRENNEMLKRIVAYVDLVQSPEYQRQKRDIDFGDNLLANAIIEKIFTMFNFNNQNLR